MTELANAVKALGIGAAAFTAVTAIGALLKLLVLFLQGLEQAEAGSLPIEILTAMIFIVFLASMPWWLPVDL